MLVSCLPDTGCSQTILSGQLARQLRLEINKNNNVQLYTANGRSVNIEGTSDLIIQNGDVSIKSSVIVANALSHSVLISWHDYFFTTTISSFLPPKVRNAGQGGKLPKTNP